MSNWTILGKLVMAPVMGAAFALFLPFIGFYLLGRLLVDAMLKRARTILR